MTDGPEVRIQMRGPGDNGWAELAPQPDPQGGRWSAFHKRNVTAATVVEALATLVWEATLRVKPRGYSPTRKDEGDTTLGLAAVGAGTGLENAERLMRVEASLDRIEQHLQLGKYKK